MADLPVDFDKFDEAIQSELFQNVLPFWVKHSPDRDRGGFFSCLDESGEIYDRRKFMWLNGRQIWMFARVCSSDLSDQQLSGLSSGSLNKSDMLQLAAAAADFMLSNGVREDGLVYFSLAEDGSPYHFERKIFSACFLCMGLGALSAHRSLPRADHYRESALDLLHRIISLAHDPTPLGRPQCSGAPAASPMNVPMILLNVIDEMRVAGVLQTNCAIVPIDYEAEEQWCIEQILKHVIVTKKVVLENVSPDGSLLPGYDGRHMNPGHAIEAGWFVLAYARRTGREDLKIVARNMIEWSFEIGWDREHGGLFYFLDSEGKSPPYLEWNMKLWWPHTEALIAYAMLYEDSREKRYWDRFCVIYDYTISHFSDAIGGGEWFGYLDRSGARTHRFKGGPYKGCFHVPRSLFFVSEIFHQLKVGKNK